MAQLSKAHQDSQAQQRSVSRRERDRKEQRGWYSTAIVLGILVATKLDQGHRRAVGQEEAEHFAKQNSLAYFETSALDPNSVEAPFYYLSHTFHERFEDHITATSKVAADV